jgi:hypothetical protein
MHVAFPGGLARKAPLRIDDLNRGEWAPETVLADLRILPKVVVPWSIPLCNSLDPGDKNWTYLRCSC